MDDLEEDEETLQLKLAAIEAKLKLKKLQQNRDKVGTGSNGRHRLQSSQPVSSTSNIPTVRSGDNVERTASKVIEVPVSPKRKTTTQVEQRSPGRVLLGIDKGVKGIDVSLRRARSVRDRGSQEDRPIKTFSERMAENRAQEHSLGKKREVIASKRGVGFQLNHAELESLKKASAEARTHNPPRSDRQCASFSREDVLRTQDRRPPGSAVLKRSSTLPNLREHNASSSHTIGDGTATYNSASREIQPSGRAHAGGITEVRPNADHSLYDPFSQLHLSSRALPHSFLQRTFPPETHACLRLPQLLKQVTAPAYELPGLEAKDVVIVGVIASKSTPLDHKQGRDVNSAANKKTGDDWERKWEDGSQNQKRFMVLQLSDLTWSVDLYLFGTALPRYHRLAPGTVVAILNPGIMPPRTGKEDTGAFSLTLHHGEETLLEIGSARDLGFCNAVKKDGQQCGSWVNLAKTEICEWHLNAQVTKTQAGRMGVNTGSTAIGRNVAGNTLKNRLVAGGNGGRGAARPPLLGHQGRRFDRGSQNQYFISSSGEAQRRSNGSGPDEVFEKSVSVLMDLDDNDPFVAEGRLSRDIESRLKKRLLNEEKEREIAWKLTRMGSGGAGGEYLKIRAASTPDGAYPADHVKDDSARKTWAAATKDDIMRSGTNTNGKRAAESIRLSPVKKTRFLTEKGVREAGRESLGGEDIGRDNDELDIV